VETKQDIRNELQRAQSHLQMFKAKCNQRLLIHFSHLAGW
jgi:uncharacterized protein YicC (UPF0701 family)